MAEGESQVHVGNAALFNPATSTLIQKRHPYTGNLDSETAGDSKNAFLHCGDVLEECKIGGEMQGHLKKA